MGTLDMRAFNSFGVFYEKSFSLLWLLGKSLPVWKAYFMPLLLFGSSSSLQVIDEVFRVIGFVSWLYHLVPFNSQYYSREAALIEQVCLIFIWSSFFPPTPRDWAITKGRQLDRTTFVNEFPTLALGNARLGSRVERPLICASHVLRIGYKVVASADKPQCATWDVMHGPQKRKICFLVYCPWLSEVTILGGIIFSGTGGTVFTYPPRYGSQSIQLGFYEKFFLLSFWFSGIFFWRFNSLHFILDIMLCSTYLLLNASSHRSLSQTSDPHVK